MNKLRAYHAARLVRGAHQGQGWKIGGSSAKCSRHPLGMCLQRGWEESHRHAPTRQEARGRAGAKSPYKGARGRGGGSSLTNPHCPKEDGGEREVTLALAGCTAVVVLETNSSKGGRCFCFQPTVSRHSRSSFWHRDAWALQIRQHSQGWRQSCAWKRSKWNERRRTLKAAQGRTRQGIPRRSSLRLWLPCIWKFCF